MKKKSILLLIFCLFLGLPLVNAGEVQITPLPVYDSPVACTMEYAPVCWLHQIQCFTTPCNPIETTFANRCIFNSTFWNVFLYEWECRVKLQLSETDMKTYNIIKEKLDTKYQQDISNTVSYYLNRIDWYSVQRKIKINDMLIVKLNEIISGLNVDISDNTKISTSIYNKYLILSVFRFELMQLDFNNNLSL